MRAELVEISPEPEKLVCTAARNDYRQDGILDYSFEEIMEGVAVDEDGEPIERLIRKLMKDGHWGVFEHPQATIAIEGVSRTAMAQITRHRHFTFDIMSLRYVDISDKDDWYQIPNCLIEGEAISRDEGVSEIDDEAKEIYIDNFKQSLKNYNELQDLGVPKEEARKVLGMGTKVNIVMSGNIRAWLHLLNIRGKGNVQGEARRITDEIFDELNQEMPTTFEVYDKMLPMKLNP